MSRAGHTLLMVVRLPHSIRLCDGCLQSSILLQVDDLRVAFLAALAIRAKHSLCFASAICQESAVHDHLAPLSLPSLLFTLQESFHLSLLGFLV